MPLSGCESDIIIACAVVNYSQSCIPEVIYALWSLCCMSAISDVWEREVKGRWKERRGRWGNGGKKVSKLQTVWVRDGGCFFFFFLFLASTLHTAGRLIHSSAGLQYQNSNYRGIFCYLWLSPIIGSEVPQLYAKACLNCREKNPLHECCTCPKSWILTTFWWYPGRINTWQNFFFFFPFLMHHIHVAVPGE